MFCGEDRSEPLHGSAGEQDDVESLAELCQKVFEEIPAEDVEAMLVEMKAGNELVVLSEERKDVSLPQQQVRLVGVSPCCV